MSLSNIPDTWTLTQLGAVIENGHRGKAEPEEDRDTTINGFLELAVQTQYTMGELDAALEELHLIELGEKIEGQRRE